jgi:hypothetical protein
MAYNFLLKKVKEDMFMLVLLSMSQSLFNTVMREKSPYMITNKNLFARCNDYFSITNKFISIIDLSKVE